MGAVKRLLMDYEGLRECVTEVKNELNSITEFIKFTEKNKDIEEFELSDIELLNSKVKEEMAKIVNKWEGMIR